MQDALNFIPSYVRVCGTQRVRKISATSMAGQYLI